MNAPKQGRSTVNPDDIARVLQQGGGQGAGRWAKVVIAAGGLMLLAAAVWWATMSGQQGSGTSYRTDEARPADITVIVTATGTLEPTKKIDISSELSGIIRTVKVNKSCFILPSPCGARFPGPVNVMATASATAVSRGATGRHSSVNFRQQTVNTHFY